MFCPNCRTEYREGIETCADCGVKLVEALPPEDFLEADLITVYKSHELNEISIAQSILEEAGIDFAMKGGMSKEILSVGPAEIQVHPDDAAQARELLLPLSEDRAPDDFIEPPPDEGDTESDGDETE